MTAEPFASARGQAMLRPLASLRLEYSGLRRKLRSKAVGELHQLGVVLFGVGFELGIVNFCQRRELSVVSFGVGFELGVVNFCLRRELSVVSFGVGFQLSVVIGRHPKVYDGLNHHDDEKGDYLKARFHLVSATAFAVVVAEEYESPTGARLGERGWRRKTDYEKSPAVSLGPLERAGTRTGWIRRGSLRPEHGRQGRVAGRRPSESASAG